MRKKLLALAAASVAVMAGALVFAASPASAATPQTPVVSEDCAQPELDKKPEVSMLSLSRVQLKLPCRQIEFVDNCDETVTVNVSNTADADSPFDVRFRIQLGAPGPAGDWVSKALNGGDSDSVTISKTDNQDIQVQSRFPAGVGPWLNFGDEHDWSWNASCLEVTSVSNCDNTFKVSVKNISTEDGEFTWQLGLSDSETVDIPAGQTLSENFTKGQVVEVRTGKDADVIKTLEFVQPKDCATASPSPSPSPSASDDNENPPVVGPQLPTTGESLSNVLVPGVALVLFAMLIGVSTVVKKRMVRDSE